MKKIDFIITWVDGNDPVWQENKAKYQNKGEGDVRASRYRDWGTLKYWFRGVENYAPWVNKIFFVTQGHLPKWLNTNNPKLVIVNHKDYIPEQYLPTFSSRTIDMNFHRIPELSEHFVYFNDDMFIISPTKEEDFFVNGLPCDNAILNAIIVNAKGRNGEPLLMDAIYTPAIYNTAIINRNFNKKKSIKKNWKKWMTPYNRKELIRTLLLLPWDEFVGFRNFHLPYGYLKSTYSEVWKKEPEVLEKACEHKFRVSTDVNHYIFTNWQYAKGTFYPRRKKIGELFHICDDNKKLVELKDIIQRQKYKVVCLNDEYNGLNYENTRIELLNAFEKILPNMSTFEQPE